jgi:uroporphyrinogen decarboxylase
VTDSLFLRACRGERLPTPPLWLMRQAGRYLPEYRSLRAGRTMLEAISTPDLAAEITLQPIRRFGFDAAILFSDLTVTFTAMGSPFDIKEGVGPVLQTPVRTDSELAALRPIEPGEDLPFVMETIKILKQELRVPLIGFTGAPFTLAAYLIEGGPSKDHRRTRALMHGEPKLWHRIMDLLSTNVVRFLGAQIEAGADAVQLFDSWIGVLDERSYREFVLPHVRSIFDRLERYEVPKIHFGTGTAHLLPAMQEAGGSVLGVDWRITLTQAADSLIPGPLQGNLDPAVLLTNPQIVADKAREIVQQGRTLHGHIFNLGHGIFLDTPIENVEALVRAVREVE